MRVKLDSVGSNESGQMGGRQTGHRCGGKRGGREWRWNNSRKETDGRQKQDGGMQKIEETEGCGQTEMSVDRG